MPKAYPIELRSRVVDHVLLGHSHRSTAGHFKVSVKFVNDMMKPRREKGSLLPKVQRGRAGRGKLDPYRAWIVESVESKRDITLMIL